MLSDILFITGVATVLLGLFSGKLSPALAMRRKWILTGGVVILAISFLFGWPDFLQGLRDGFRSASG